MQLRLSHVRLRAIIVLVVSKTKGITLVFKNDPLESVQVSSTFDSVAVIAKYLQQEIEGQLKEVFREDLPGIIHRLSQKWLSGNRAAGQPSASGSRKGNAADAGVNQGSNEAGGNGNASTSSPRRTRKKSNPGAMPGQDGPDEDADQSRTRPKLSKSASTPSRLSREEEDTAAFDALTASTSFDDIESYDPTYGLRPDEVRLPKKGQGFKGLKGLKKQAGSGFGSTVGLAGLLEEDPTLLDQQVYLDQYESATPDSAESAEREVAETPSPLAGDLDGPASEAGSDVDDVAGLPVASPSSLSPPQPQSPRESFGQQGQAASLAHINDAFGHTHTPSIHRIPRSVTGVGLGNTYNRAASVISAGARSSGSSPAAQRLRATALRASSAAPSSSNSSSSLHPHRPRIFHASSQIRPPMLNDQADDSLGSQYGRSSWAGSMRSESVAGTAIAGGTGYRSGPGSSRTFTLRSKSSVGPTSDHPAQSPLRSGGGSDFFTQAGNLERGHPELNYEDGDFDEGDDGDVISPSISRSESTPSLHSSSRAGTLSTLEPEPMDHSTAAYKKLVSREEIAGKRGLYRPGWNTIDEEEEAPRGKTQQQATPTQNSKPAMSRSQSALPGTTWTPSPTANNPRRSAPLQPRASNQNTSSTHPRLQLQDLANSNQTLSPYTRMADSKGWTVRSTPGTPGGGSGPRSATPSLGGSGSDLLQEGLSSAGKRRTFSMAKK